MLTDERIKELAVRFGLLQFGSRDVVENFTREIEAECRQSQHTIDLKRAFGLSLPQIDGLEEALKPSAIRMVNRLKILTEAANAYFKASKGE